MKNNTVMRNELLSIAESAFSELGRLGVDGAELSVSRGRMDEFNIDAGEFSLLRTTFNSALSVRVIAGGAKGAAVTNSLDPEAVAKALSQAADAAKSSDPDDAEYIADCIGEHKFYIGGCEQSGGEYGDERSSGCDSGYDRKYDRECDRDGLYGRLREFMDGCAIQYPKIQLFQLISRFSSSSALYANTNGTRVYTDSAAYRHVVDICARDGDRVSSFNGFGFAEGCLGSPFLDRSEVRRLLSETERQIDTAPVGGKFVGTILLSPDCFAEMLFSIIDNCVTDTPLIAGSSPWIGKLGGRVADERLDISLDPLDPRIVCGARITGDGHLTRRQDIIRGGVLTGWALSQYGAKKTGLERAGNISGNLIVGAGDKSFEELVSGIKRGLFINRFSGGAPAKNGDFSGIAKNSFLISDGKIAGAVSETMVSGNLLDMIQNLVGLGNEAVCDGGCAVPFAAFDGITISGK